jgi:hypothetical protein
MQVTATNNAAARTVKQAATPVAPAAGAPGNVCSVAFVWNTGSDKVVQMRLRAMFYQMPNKSVASLRQIATLTDDPRQSAEARSLALLLRSGALGLLAQKGENPIGNGKHAYASLIAAVDADPKCFEAVQAYGRETLGIHQLGGFKRFIATNGGGIKLSQDTTRVLTLLAAFPNDATCQLVASKLAVINKDTNAQQAADANLARLAKTAPRAVASARGELGGDAQVAAKAKAPSASSTPARNVSSDTSAVVGCRG